MAVIVVDGLSGSLVEELKMDTMYGKWARQERLGLRDGLLAFGSEGMRPLEWDKSMHLSVLEMPDDERFESIARHTHLHSLAAGASTRGDLKGLTAFEATDALRVAWSRHGDC